MRKLLLLIMCSFIAGCLASDPRAITATPMPAFTYAALDCTGLANEDARVAEDLGYLSYRQENRRTGDALGMVMLGVTSTGLGQADFAAQIAQLKGQRDAILQTKVTKGCTQTQAPIDASTKAKIRWRQRAATETAPAASSKPAARS